MEKPDGGRARAVWRALAVVWGVGGGLLGVALMAGATMVAGYGRRVGGDEAWGADEVRIFCIGLAVAALAVGTAVGLWRGQRWARIVTWLLAAGVVGLGALVLLDTVLEAAGAAA